MHDVNRIALTIEEDFGNPLKRSLGNDTVPLFLTLLHGPQHPQIARVFAGMTFFAGIGKKPLL